MNTRSVLGAYFMIMSQTKGCSHIKASLNRHINKMEERVRAMTHKEFDEQRNSVLTQYQAKDKSILLEFKRYWNDDISTHEHLTDRRDQEIAVLKELTLKDLQKNFKKLLSLEGANRIDIHWNSLKHKPDEEKAHTLLDNYGYESKEEKFESVN